MKTLRRIKFFLEIVWRVSPVGIQDERGRWVRISARTAWDVAGIVTGG